jgi:hypothetical protein
MAFEISEVLEKIDDIPEALICDLCGQKTKRLNKMRHHRDLEICANCLEDFHRCD